MKRIFPLFFISFFLLIFFWQILFGNKTFFCGDTLTIFYPLKTQFFKSLSQGTFPLWSSSLHAGYPIFADISAGLYYPPNFLLFFPQSMNAVSLLIVFHFFAASVAMYFLSRKLAMSPHASIFAGIIYAVSGIMVNYIAEPPRLATISLYPLFFLSLIQALEKRKLVWILLSGLVLSAQIFAGHIQYVYIEILASPAFLLFDKFKIAFRKKMLIFSAVVFLGVVFAGIAILPAFEFLPFTTRADIAKDISVYQNFSLAPVSLVRFFMAHFWGIRNQGSAWGTMDTTTIGYIGAIPLLLIFLTFRKIIKNRNTRILLITAVSGLVISFGTHLPFFSFFVNVIPIFAIFRNPMAFLIVYTFFTSLLAGYSLDIFILSKKKKYFLTIISAVAAVTALIVFIIAQFNPNLPFSLLKALSALIHKNLSSFHTPEVDFLIAGFILKNILVISILFAFGLFFNSKKMWILFVCIDLLLFGSSNMFITNSNDIKTDSSSVSFLQKNLTPQYRYLSTSEAVPFSGLNDYCSSLTMQPPFSKEGKRLSALELAQNMQHEFAMLSPNFGSLYNLSTINGYTTFILKSYNDIFQKSSFSNSSYKEAARFNPHILETRADATIGKINFSNIDFNDELFDDLAVKYIITDRELGLTHHKLVFSNDRISIFENLNVKPRAIVVDEAGSILETPQITSENSNSIELATGMKGKLILADVFYPGWKAYAGDKELPIKPYKNILRSVELEDSVSRIRFEFKPQSFYIGFFISATSISLAVLLIFYSLLRRK